MTDWILVFVMVWADPPIYTAPVLVFEREKECRAAGAAMLPAIGRNRFSSTVSFYCIARTS